MSASHPTTNAVGWPNGLVIDASNQLFIILFS